MNKTYEKPVVLVNSESAEGVYLASGCYTVNAYIHQTPETGRENYVIQVNGKHNAEHNCNAQILTITFNQNVTYKSSAGTLVSGDGTNTLQISYNYWNNHTDNIGLGDLAVKTTPAVGGTPLEIIGYSLDDAGHQC